MQYITTARHGREPYPVFSLTYGEPGVHQEDMPTRLITLEQLPEPLLPLSKMLREADFEVLSIVLAGVYYAIEKVSEGRAPWCVKARKSAQPAQVE